MDNVFKFSVCEILKPIGNFNGIDKHHRFFVHKHIKNDMHYGNSYLLFNLYTGDKIMYPVLFANERFELWATDPTLK